MQPSEAKLVQQKPLRRLILVCKNYEKLYLKGQYVYFFQNLTICLFFIISAFVRAKMNILAFFLAILTTSIEFVSKDVREGVGNMSLKEVLPQNIRKR